MASRGRRRSTDEEVPDSCADQSADTNIDNDKPLKRRRRIRLACQVCRDRKIRCDGGTPVCDTCRRKKIDARLCVYPEVQGNLSLSNLANDSLTLTFKPSDATLLASPERTIPLTPSLLAAQGQQHSNRAREEASRALHDTFSWAAGSHGAITQGMVGSESNSGFGEDVYENLHDALNDGLDSLAPPSIRYGERAPISTVESEKFCVNIEPFLADLSLPPKSLIDRLLDIYWKDIHPQSPVFHEQTFMKRYDRFWHEGLASSQGYNGKSTGSLISSSERIIFATINLVLALVHQRTLSGQPTYIPTTKDAFYGRADRLLTPDLLELESLELVQALVLKAAYLREADMTNRSWIAAGTAIRAAQAAGLYNEYAGGSQAEREERRRLWYSCVLMDRVQSMTYARPTMISEPSSLSYPTIIDDEFISMNPGSADAIQPTDVASHIGFESR
ncbi:hypothetical protein DPV78_000999 [Talaromyces pinophilus]|nr:hypothetical protein DPV78_000999 [Talaromyces pinophilus]